MLRIKKNDKVMIIGGKDRGKIGKVLKVFPKGDRILVEKLNFFKKAKRKTQQDQQGGIIELEMPLHISNVMLVDRKASKPTRFRVSNLKDGTKVRISKGSQEAI